MDYRITAQRYIDDLGGSDNISALVNCATRIRAVVNNAAKVLPPVTFKAEGAIDVSRHGKMLQIVIGLDAPQILEEMRILLKFGREHAALDEYGLTQAAERARIIIECFGLPENILQVTMAYDAVIVHVIDPAWVDPYDVMLQLDVGIDAVALRGHLVYLYVQDAKALARELNGLLKRPTKSQ
ncbi:PTS transporter subunit EIIB [Lacticaseibacillus baoqingensis]|uniref:PTS transporter subunit EIIB n=1 Tax=Lacticaseibacillus baoqingensis TaxID=2486013 RepID=A0ABW4E7P1_9LACO|nr:PTS transporter subunit EIIB [Lacticaseibacillus baoqingensis]